jgi:hypothetical protein
MRRTLPPPCNAKSPHETPTAVTVDPGGEVPGPQEEGLTDFDHALKRGLIVHLYTVEVVPRAPHARWRLPPPR